MRKIWTLVLMSALAVSSAHGQDTADAATQRRLALAKQYMDITHRSVRVREMLGSSVRRMWNTCNDDDCRKALDQAIEKAVNDTSPDFEKAYIKLLAAHLTEDDLKAVIAFIQSPQGKAVMAAEADMDGHIVDIVQPYALSTSESVRHSFCATQAQACARVYARYASKPSGGQ